MDNKLLARRALEEIYAKGDLGLLDELIHPDFADHDPAHPDLPTGHESVRDTVQNLHGMFSELRFEVEDEIDIMIDGEADRVVPTRLDVLPGALRVYA